MTYLEPLEILNPKQNTSMRFEFSVLTAAEVIYTDKIIQVQSATSVFTLQMHYNKPLHRNS